MSDYLLPIADREPLAWIIEQQRTAVGAHRRTEAEKLDPGDRILLYTTRGCFRNPTRDRGLIIGQADVVNPARVLPEPMCFRGREYPIGVDLRIRSLAPIRHGVELAPIVGQLQSFPNKKAWSGYLRRALVPITASDADILAAALARVSTSYARASASYAT
jgi:hypothetical protein